MLGTHIKSVTRRTAGENSRMRDRYAGRTESLHWSITAPLTCRLTERFPVNLKLQAVYTLTAHITRASCVAVSLHSQPPSFPNRWAKESHTFV